MKEKKRPPKAKTVKPEKRESVWAQEIFQSGRQTLQHIVGSSPIPTFIIGKDHRVIYWNKALEELSGIKAKDVVGTNQQWRAFYKTERPCMADLLVEEFHKDIPRWYAGKYIKSALIEGAYEATDFFPDLGKRGRWLRFTAALIRNGKGSIIGAIETLEDITQAKRAEEALLKAHEELEIKIKERTLDLARANQALQETSDHLSLILDSLPLVSYTCTLADQTTRFSFVSKRIK